MTKLELEIHDDLLTVVNKIKNLDDSGIELEIPEGSLLFDNVHNLKLIEKEADRINKTIHFITKDEFGQNLLSSMDTKENSDFLTKEISLNEDTESYEDIKPNKKSAKKGLPSFVSVTSKFKSRKAKIFKITLVLLLLAGGSTYAGYKALWTVPKANVKVTVNAQPLIKSVQIKVAKDSNTDTNAKTLKGYGVSYLTKNEDVAPATGEKIVGETAKGKIKIFNKTTQEEKFKKGQIVKYDNNDLTLEFKLTNDVTVPERTEDPVTLVITPGEADVEVEATQIGEEYNIDKDKTLDVDDQDNDDFSAKTDKDFEGGKSEIVKIITEEDRLNLSTKVFEDNSDDIEKELSSRAGAGKTYIQGSIKTSIANETFDKEIDAEAPEVKLEQEISAIGLAYSDRELRVLLEQMLEEFVPEGYELSSKDTELKVEILGNAETTVVSPEESDLQVTIKAFVITEVNEDEIKNQLIGKPITDAQKYLGGIRNIETYELEVSPNIPFWQKMPKNIENINVQIEKK